MFLKEKYVAEVIELLHQKADLEAKLLFDEYIKQRKSKSLVELSQDISDEMKQKIINSVLDSEMNLEGRSE